MTIATLRENINLIPQQSFYGTIHTIQGLLAIAHVSVNFVKIGTRCSIHVNGHTTIPGEIVGFRQGEAQIMGYESLEGIGPGCRVDYLPDSMQLFPSLKWCGRVLNGIGNPVDKQGLLPLGSRPIPSRQSPPSAHSRQKIGKRIDLGVRALNTFITCCQGQRLGIFAGSGVGKSMLLSMLARFTHCDVCVIGLVGERGREVRDFIEDTLGEEGLRKSVVVVATSDESPLMRRQAAYTTLAVAEYFRDEGKSVLCLVDSMTRFAMAQREIGLSAGEPPTTKGYPPSVFTELAKIMERAGPGVNEGLITAFFTVLVDGDDHNEPIADAARGILDGHIVLERQIAERGRYPGINILRSLSRTVPGCHSDNENKVVRAARKIITTYEDMVEMIRLGAYKQGSNPEVDLAISLYPKLEKFLNQNYQEYTSLEDSFDVLTSIMKENNE